MPLKLACHSYTLSTLSQQLLMIWKRLKYSANVSLVGWIEFERWFLLYMESSRVSTNTKGNWRYVSWDLGKTSDSQLQLHWNELCHFPRTAPARPVFGPNASPLGNILYTCWRTKTEVLSSPELPERHPFAPCTRDWIQWNRLNSVYSLTNRFWHNFMWKYQKTGG